MPKTFLEIRQDLYISMKSAVDHFNTWGMSSGSPRVIEMLFRLSGMFWCLTQEEQSDLHDKYPNLSQAITMRSIRIEGIPKIKEELRAFAKEVFPKKETE